MRSIFAVKGLEQLLKRCHDYIKPKDSQGIQALTILLSFHIVKHALIAYLVDIFGNPWHSFLHPIPPLALSSHLPHLEANALTGERTMALTKADLIERIQSNNDLTNKQSTDIVEATIGIIKDTLATGEDVLISGFGKLCVKEKAERKGRNPATGEDQMLPARRVVTFKCSGKLRDKVNGR
jgi:integration host factor subunit alpha